MISDSKRMTPLQWGTLWKDCIFIFFLFFIVLVSVLYIYAKSLLILLLVTALLFILLDPIVLRLSRSISRGVAVLLALFGFLVCWQC